MNKKKTLKKCLKTALITLAISVTSIFSANNVSKAYGIWQGNENSGMPSLSYSESGLFPQILQQRKFTGNADNQFPYSAWTTDMSTGTVYCNDAGKAVRFGSYDSKQYYIDEVGYTTSNGYGYSDFEEKVKNYLKVMAVKQCLANIENQSLPYGFSYSDIGLVQYMGPKGTSAARYAIDKEKPMLSYTSLVGMAKAYSDARSLSEQLMNQIFSKLENWKTPQDTDDVSTNPDTKQSAWDGNGTYGPEVVIMETKDRAENHYQQVGTTETETNTQLAFVLTTMENAYSGVTGSIRNRYSLSDIQTAHWKVADLDGNIPNGSHLTQNGLLLYDKAKSYKEFVEKYINGNSYKAQIHGVAANSYAAGTKTAKQTDSNTNTTNDPLAEAQVIVNQATKSYIVGPLSITYPFYEDISYLKAIYLVTDPGTDNEKTLVYDEKKVTIEEYKKALENNYGKPLSDKETEKIAVGILKSMADSGIEIND